MLIVIEPEGLEREAQFAREMFALNGPFDAPPLPLSYNEREDLKVGGLSTIVALYARSLENLRYDLEEHPSFVDYARGVMASELNVHPGMKEDEGLRRRFPPRSLRGLGPGLCWKPSSQSMKKK
jgi:hypothetical protein